MLDSQPHAEDFLLAQKCIEGDPQAIRRLQESFRVNLVNYLNYAGATAEEAGQLVNELWSDCLVDRPERGPRLATYSGNSPLQAWLKAVALNKLVQLKRRRKREVVIVEPGPGEPPPPTETRESLEAPLLEIMRGAVQTAFHECDPEDFVLVQLALANGLYGRELAQMFGCSEAKISRDLASAKAKIAGATLSYVRAEDPWLELQWEDFLELCRVASPACFGVE